MGNSVLKVSLWLSRSCHQLLKYSQGFGVWLHSCWSWWRLKCFQSCCCWEHLSSLSKCQSGMRCFPWDHSLSQTKAAGIELWGTAENPCAASATGNGCCCILQIFPPTPWENFCSCPSSSEDFSLQLQGHSMADLPWPGSSSNAPALQELSTHWFSMFLFPVPQGNLALSVLGNSWDRLDAVLVSCGPSGADTVQASSASTRQRQSPSWPGGWKVPLQAQGFCRSLGKITHSSYLIFHYLFCYLSTPAPTKKKLF